jgi:membrane-bound serine protease (ClpP class)
LDVKGAIGPATTEYLSHGLDAAAARKAAAVVIRIDTPGGLVSSTREIIQAMLASPVPVITYVAPSGAQAASAGTYIVYASQLAAMAPGTNIGAATVVSMGAPPGSERDRSPAPKTRTPDRTRNATPGRDEPVQDPDVESKQESNATSGQGNSTPRQGPDVSSKNDTSASEGPVDPSERKAINDAAAFIRSLADLHGRNAQWAEKAVRDGVSIPAQEALQEKVVEIVAADMENLLAQADGRTVKLNGKTATLSTRDAAVVPITPDWRTRFLGVITNPNIAYLLMLLGVYGIVFELMTPGAIFPGVLGAVALVTGLFALNLLPVNYAGVGLVLLGIGLMAAEAFTPTLGLVGVAGAAIFALGSLFMFDSSQPAFALSIPVVVSATLVIALLLAIMLAVSVRAHRRKSVSGDSILIGHIADVLSWSGEQGRGSVRLGDEIWDARGAGPHIPGDRVVVIARDGLTLTVGDARNAYKENAS